jgi:hypothetical protein
VRDEDWPPSRPRRATGTVRRPAGGRPRGAAATGRHEPPTARTFADHASWLVPAVGVIVTVAVVVMLAMIVYNRSDDDPSQAAGPQRSSAVGSVPLNPPDDWYRPSTLPSGRTSAAPGRSTTQAQPAGTVLQLRRSGVPELVNLSAEGRRDWVHWGHKDVWSMERKRDGGFAILEGTPTAPRRRHDASPQKFAWGDGDPVAKSSGTSTGIRTCGADNGFTIAVPAGRADRTLQLYLGVAKARGRLEARLSTGGRAVTEVLDSTKPMETAMFTLTFKAPRDGKLKVVWVTERAYDEQFGGVTIQAASLQ